MRRLVLVLPAVLVMAAPAVAAEGPVQASFGYSFAQYLETGGGTAPVGAFLTLSGRKSVTLELDLGWQRRSDESGAPTAVIGVPAAGSGGVTLNTFTVTAGPKFNLAMERAVKLFVHVLGGLRHDSIEFESNTAWGGFAGGGVDIKAGDRVSVRLGADFQIFFDQGENLKTLRLGVGLTF
ncbi:MAG TPA: outer membrane beta-barrel protein [Vicinamibacteria bacterium]|nr:outer membrane beta-barrel protein [Vicinamibacteria bacterium]